MYVGATENKRSRIHPLELSLYIACGSMLMMFAALTSAYIVRQSAGNWLEFDLPSLFYVSTAVLLLTSVVLEVARYGFKHEKVGLYRGGLALALIFAFSFVITQFEAWQEMYAAGLLLKGNPAPAFVYVISGLHAVHVLGGIVALIFAAIIGFKLPVVATPRRKLRLRLTAFYWHFVDFLWIYLLLFFLLQR